MSHRLPLAVAVSLLLALACHAGTDGTQKIRGDRWLACRSREAYQQLMSFTSADDIDAMAKLITSNQCIHLKNGREVSLEDPTGSDSLVSFHITGSPTLFWTTSEAFK